MNYKKLQEAEDKYIIESIIIMLFFSYMNIHSYTNVTASGDIKTDFNVVCCDI